MMSKLRGGVGIKRYEEVGEGGGGGWEGKEWEREEE
jgi:hypothetical protein